MVLSLQYRLLEYDPLFLIPNWNYIARFDRKTIAPAKSFYSRNRKRKQTWKPSIELIEILSNCPGVENPTIICDFRKDISPFCRSAGSKIPREIKRNVKINTPEKMFTRVWSMYVVRRHHLEQTRFEFPNKVWPFSVWISGRIIQFLIFDCSYNYF